MQLSSPDIGLLVWVILNVLTLGLIIWALIILSKDKNFNSTEKLLWALIILFVPTIGSILFLPIKKTIKGNGAML